MSVETRSGKKLPLKTTYTTEPSLHKKNVTKTSAATTMATYAAIIPPRFATENSDEWFEILKFHALANKWEDRQLIGYIPCLLDDPAKAWYHTLPNETKENIKALQEAFASRFDNISGMRQVFVSNFNSRRLQACESLDDYLLDISKLGKRLNRSQQDILDAFIFGLPDSVKPLVLQHDPQTVDDALKHAKLCFSCHSSPLSPSSANAHPDSRLVSVVESLVEKVAQLGKAQIQTVSQRRDRSRSRGDSSGTGRQFNTSRAECYRCGNTNHRSHQCYHINSRCNACQSMGHIARACRKSRGQVPPHPNPDPNPSQYTPNHPSPRSRNASHFTPSHPSAKKPSY